MKVSKRLRAALGKGAHTFIRAKNNKVKVTEQYNMNFLKMPALPIKSRVPSAPIKA